MRRMWTLKPDCSRSRKRTCAGRSSGDRRPSSSVSDRPSRPRSARTTKLTTSSTRKIRNSTLAMTAARPRQGEEAEIEGRDRHDREQKRPTQHDRSPGDAGRRPASCERQRRARDPVPAKLGQSGDQPGPRGRSAVRRRDGPPQAGPSAGPEARKQDGRPDTDHRSAPGDLFGHRDGAHLRDPTDGRVAPGERHQGGPRRRRRPPGGRPG